MVVGRFSYVVPSRGFEPLRLAAHGPKPCVSANFTTRAIVKYYKNRRTNALLTFILL